MEQNVIFNNVSQNNLKNVSFEIIKNSITSITGPSGSGKSSLAFDTVYMEGQRRFWEASPVVIKLFLKNINRAAFETAYNIPPTIALEQINRIKTSRGTVATESDLYDLISQLYVVESIKACDCGGSFVSNTVESLAITLLKEYHGKNISILFKKISPMNNEEILKNSFVRGYSDGKWLRLEDNINNTISHVVVDRVIVNQNSQSRLIDSIEQAIKWGEKEVFIYSDRLKKFSLGYCCNKCEKIEEKPGFNNFSFNNSKGACPKCKGFGNIIEYDMILIVPDEEKTIKEGAIFPFEKPSYIIWKKKIIKFCEEIKININVRYFDLSTGEKEKLQKKILEYFLLIEKKAYRVQVKVFISRFRSEKKCPVCLGAKVNVNALKYYLFGKNIFEIMKLNIEGVEKYFQSILLPSKKGAEIIKRILELVGCLNKLGMGYIGLHRALKTLSGGELQRVRLAGCLSSGLTNTLYVLDEPTIGLHPSNIEKLILVLKEMSKRGNTLVVVEQNIDVIMASDFIIEMGPQSGARGGEIVFNGEPNEYLCKIKSILKETTAFSFNKKGIEKFLEFKGVDFRNFINVDVKIPLETFVCLTGVSGSGKSTLAKEIIFPALSKILYSEPHRVGKFRKVVGFNHIKDIVLIDQKVIPKRSKSIIATYLKFFDRIRILLSRLPNSKRLNLSPGSFSMNVAGGRCEKCNGLGKLEVDLSFMGKVEVECETCLGRKYKKNILGIKYRGKNINDILKMTIQEAILFFSDEKSLIKKLVSIKKMGLEYLPVGITVDKLSGGELQRVKMLHELQEKKRPTLYIFDEPSIGLGFYEVNILIDLFRDLVRKKHSVLCIEHNLDIISRADYIIDLGPGGGEYGGRVVFSGDPHGAHEINDSVTGRYLRKWVFQRSKF